jgi:hypothetical protein
VSLPKVAAAHFRGPSFAAAVQTLATFSSPTATRDSRSSSGSSFSLPLGSDVLTQLCAAVDAIASASLVQCS